MSSCKHFLAALALTAIAGTAAAAFPERELSGVIMWGAGGATDVVARALNPHAEAVLGKKVVLVNRAGGTGAIDEHDLLAEHGFGVRVERPRDDVRRAARAPHDGATHFTFGKGGGGSAGDGGERQRGQEMLAGRHDLNPPWMGVEAGFERSPAKHRVGPLALNALLTVQPARRYRAR